MKWLLDTCTVSDYFRRRGAVAAALHAVAPHELAISTVTEFEMRFGLARQPRLAPSLGRQVNAFLQVVRVLPFDREDAAASGLIRATLERAGRPIAPLDALIAGVAVAKGLTLVTSNEDEFSRVPGLAVENWR
ncbi:MAG: PIN domain-containing protein [Myxococcota bacterium]